MAAASANLKALKEKNAALKAQLAKLEKLASSVDKKDSKAKSEAKVKDVAAVKAAFDHFDADGSGFIDKAEFAALSSDLGELLDDEELTAAVKEIDSSGDGKISFNEFIRWWTNDKKGVDPKSPTKIAILKAKLKAREFRAVNNMLIRQLSAVKINDNEFVKHRIALSVGDFKEPKASIKAALSFGALPQDKFLGMPSVAHLTLALNDTAGAAAVETETKKFDGILGSIGLPKLIETDMKKREINVWVGVPEDPFALAVQLGLDLQKFVREVSISLELPFSPLDLSTEAGSDDKKLADLLGLRFETKLEFRKALVHTLAATLPGAQDAAFGAFLENFNFSLSLGSVGAFLKGMIPPEDVNANHAAMGGIPPQLLMMAKGAKFVLKDGSKQKLAAKYSELWQMAGESQFAELIMSARSILNQPTQLVFHSGSGVNITVDLKNIAPAAAIPPLGMAGAGGSVVRTGGKAT